VHQELRGEERGEILKPERWEELKRSLDYINLAHGR
jgi:hypothetical protein